MAQSEAGEESTMINRSEVSWCQSISSPTLSRKLNSQLAVKWIESSSHFLDSRSDQFCHNSVILTERPPYRERSKGIVLQWIKRTEPSMIVLTKPHTWSDKPRNCFQCYNVTKYHHIVLKKKYHHIVLRNAGDIYLVKHVTGDIPQWKLLQAIAAQITTSNNLNEMPELRHKYSHHNFIDA